MPEGARLYPVGRLDQDSEGLLVLTNDGAWADRVLHPRHGIEREYAIGLAGAADRRAGRTHSRPASQLDEGLATLTGLRATTEIETRRLVELLAPPPAELDLVSGDPRPGLETAAAPDVRCRRRADRAAGPGPDRPVRLDDLPSGRARRLRAPEIRGLGAGAGTSRAGAQTRQRRPSQPRPADDTDVAPMTDTMLLWNARLIDGRGGPPVEAARP